MPVKREGFHVATMWHILSKAALGPPCTSETLKLQCTLGVSVIVSPKASGIPGQKALNCPTHCSDFQQVGVQEILVEWMSKAQRWKEAWCPGGGTGVGLTNRGVGRTFQAGGSG